MRGDEIDSQIDRQTERHRTETKTEREPPENRQKDIR
jgi:hypothetical protein